MAMHALVLTSGPQAGRRFEIGEELVIGREDAGCVIEDDEVSRRHALVRVAGDDLVLEDCGSTNGTWVNGSRIDGPTVVRTGDVVRVGETAIAVESTSPPIPDVAPRSGAQPEDRSPPEAFAPPSSDRRRRIATRDLRIEIATIAVVLATAVALILYFSLA